MEEEKQHCSAKPDCDKGRVYLGMSEQSEYSARVLLNDVLKRDYEKRIEGMFNAIIRGHKWNWDKGQFNTYEYCHHREKQFCPTGEYKKFQLHIEEWYCWGDSLIDCKLQVINWFLHGRPFFPFVK